MTHQGGVGSLGLEPGRSERKKKMIFPFSTAYKSKDDCYYYFGKLFAEEPMKSSYPQTSDAQSSYIFGCIER